MREVAGVNESLDCLSERDASADENREHNEETRKTLAPRTPQEERETERNRGQRIAEVVNQVGEQGDAQGPRIEVALNQSRGGQDGETDRDRADARARAQDRTIDKAVGMALPGSVTARVRVKAIVVLRMLVVEDVRLVERRLEMMSMHSTSG